MSPLILIAVFGLLLTGLVLLALLISNRIQKGRGWIISAPAAWGAYVFWEVIATRAGANIRMDLLAIYPVLAFLTLAALIFAAWNALK